MLMSVVMREACRQIALSNGDDSLDANSVVAVKQIPALKEFGKQGNVPDDTNTTRAPRVRALEDCSAHYRAQRRAFLLGRRS
jgi:hypothetical protein